MKPSYWFFHSSGVDEKQGLSVCPGDHLDRTHLKRSMYKSYQHHYKNMPMDAIYSYFFIFFFFVCFFQLYKNETFH